jgi:valyl-tRNA synthetase
VEKIEDGYKHNVATAERSGALVEPQIMNQWFIDVNKPIATRNNKSLKQLMQEAVTSKSIQILPERFEKNYFFWIDNLQDWCISRQIWFGHRIPVWYDKTGGIHLPRSRNIIFIRHGESEGNINKIYTGRTDSPLTEKGRVQAKEAAKKLKGRTIGKIISSDLSRALETAAIISKDLGLPTESYPEFQEVFGGDLEGTKKEDTPLLIAALTAGTGETSSMLLDRARKAWEIINNDTSDGDIVIVGHGSFSAVMKAFLEGEEDLVTFRKKWHMDNAALFEFPILIDPKDDDLVQDPDTLDTWFSSGLWTFSTLGWPEQTTDLATYHPTSVLETGHDILFFWIARMVLMSTYLLGEVPFKTVYLHGMVRAADGQKMSKSLGNAAVDPLDIIGKYGNDALRLAMIIGNTPGNDLKLNENDIRGYAKFCNKIWNASRFVLENIQDLDLSEPIALDAEDQQAADELRATLETVTKEMNEYKFSLAAEKLYHYFWHTFADVLIERSKKKISESTGKQSAQWLLYTQLTTLIKALHPFMPFVTEELWSMIPRQAEPVTSDRKLLIIETWPA